MAQLPFQLVNFMLQVPAILCMGNMTLPTRVTFGGMSCAHTPLTAFSSFETPVKDYHAGSPLTLLGVGWHLPDVVLLRSDVDLLPPS